MPPQRRRPFTVHVDPMAHNEYPGVWHLTRGHVESPRRYVTYCGQTIPLLASVMGEVLPLGHPDTGPLPNCVECIRRHLLAIQKASQEAG